MDNRLTVACHIQRQGEPAFPDEPLGFSVDLTDPQDIRRAEHQWEELAFVIEHVLEEALVKLGISPCKRCQGKRRVISDNWTTLGVEYTTWADCEVCTRAAIKDTFRGVEGIA